MEKEQLRPEMEQARRATLSLFHDIVRQEDDLHRPLGGFRPLLWHLGHIGAFEAYWLLQRMGQAVPLPGEYMKVFDPMQTPREASRGLPSLCALTELVTQIREYAFEQLERVSFDTDDRLLRDGYVFEMALEHERQHQETVCYLLHLLDPAAKRPPADGRRIPSTHQAVTSEDNMVFIPGGEFELGATDDNGFVYDNELPAHTVSVSPFQIDRHLVTNAAYRAFIDAGGYDDPRFWDADGWVWRTDNKIEHPLHWLPESHGWCARSMFDAAPLKPDVPVYGVSWYEASAYARFVGKRLPTEAEWVAAAYYDWHRERRQRFPWGDAAPDPRRTNFSNHFWTATPVGSFPPGRSPAGCLDMAGNVWEWTATVFDGYPGFQPYPYPEYSQVWFDGDHRVLKGGSWATHRSLLRSSFRNFFRRDFRVAFAGFRCARSRGQP